MSRSRFDTMVRQSRRGPRGPDPDSGTARWHSMARDAPGPRLLHRSGAARAVAPAVTTALVVFVALLVGGVQVLDVLRATLYLVLGLVLPGFVLWRLLVSRRGGDLLGDLVLGAVLGYAVELPVY